MAEAPATAKARRNRLIAIGAGVITVIAIVLGFAGDFLGLPWHWMRPVAELLLLAELVGLVVLERHQLFEPVHATVGELKTHSDEIRASLAALTERLNTAGQVAICVDAGELLRTSTRLARDALARDQPTPQILRVARLSGSLLGDERSDLAVETSEWINTLRDYSFLRTSLSDSRARRWTIHLIGTVASLESFERAWDRFLTRELAENGPINLEFKLRVRSQAEPVLAPGLITDRDALLLLGDAHSSFRWGLTLHSPEMRALVVQWFDDLWATISDANLIYSHGVLNQRIFDRIRRELEAVETASVRQLS
jgi:hypothetical protein